MDAALDAVDADTTVEEGAAADPEVPVVGEGCAYGWVRGVREWVSE